MLESGRNGCIVELIQVTIMNRVVKCHKLCSRVTGVDLLDTELVSSENGKNTFGKLFGNLGLLKVCASLQGFWYRTFDILFFERKTQSIRTLRESIRRTFEYSHSRVLEGAWVKRRSMLCIRYSPCFYYLSGMNVRLIGPTLFSERSLMTLGTWVIIFNEIQVKFLNHLRRLRLWRSATEAIVNYTVTLIYTQYQSIFWTHYAVSFEKAFKRKKLLANASWKILVNSLWH